ncbi:ribbon-helix-helix domain-containing protein [Candidatus Bathyarchaeota archaeon]|nr:ribbon-helix-helix domain-containing protein [Candidatus Bathyarchaeota archaeon]
MSKSDNVRINARIPASLKGLMQKFVALDSHMSESELVRDAIREKIQREAPQLYRKLFEEALKNEQR